MNRARTARGTPDGATVRRTRPVRASATAVVGMLVALLTLLTLPAPAGATTPTTGLHAATADDEAPLGVTLTLRTLSPAVTRPGDDLQLVVEIDNPTQEAIDDARLDVAVAWQPIFSRSTLASWVAGTIARPPSSQLRQPLDPVEPGEDREVTLTLPVDDLGLGARGPFRMAIVLRDADTVVTEIRTFLLWDPDPSDDGDTTPATDDGDTVRLSLLAALTGPPVDPRDPFDTRMLAGAVAPGEPLTRTLAAVDEAQQATGTPGALALAADPALMATAATAANAQVSSWADRVVAAGESTHIYPLPPYDPDLAALAHAGLTTPALTAATTTPLPQDWPVPEAWGGTLAWPVGPQAPDLATLDAARAAGLETAVLPAGLAPTFGTTTGRTTVMTSSGPITALLADEPITDALVDATDVALGSVAPPTTPAAVQRLLAETAVVALQGSGDQPHLLAVMPRGWAPDLGALRTALEALSSSGWVRVAPLPELLGAAEPSTERWPLEAATPHAAELAPDDVHRLDEARTRLDRLASVATDPDALVAPLAPVLAAPTSVAWRDDPDGRAEAVNAAVDTVSATEGAIVVTSPDALLISAEGDLPVLVSNSLPTDATVTVRLRPDTPRLVVDEIPTTTVPAEGSVRVNVPVRALGSGDVDVVVEVLAPDGSPAATPVTLELRVRAGWETAGTAVAAGVVALLLVVGIWRTVRRGRSANRTMDDLVPDPVIPSDRGRS